MVHLKSTQLKRKFPSESNLNEFGVQNLKFPGEYIIYPYKFHGTGIFIYMNAEFSGGVVRMIFLGIRENPIWMVGKAAYRDHPGIGWPC